MNIFRKGGDEKIYYIKFNKYRKAKNPNKLYVFGKTIVFLLLVMIVTIMMKKIQRIRIKQIIWNS